MAAHALRLHHHLRPAPLADFDGGGGGLAHDDEVRLGQPGDLPGGDPLETLLVDGAGHADLPGEIPAGVLREVGHRGDHGRYAALHVRCAPAIDPPLVDLPAEGVVGPLPGVDHVHMVDMPVQKDGLARPAAPHPAQYAAVPVDEHLIEAVLLHFALHQLGHFPLLPGWAGDPDGLLAERNQLLVSVHVSAPFSTAAISYMQYVIYCNFIMDPVPREVNESPPSPEDFYRTYQTPDPIL